MRIIHIIWALNSGGAETLLVDIVNWQVQTEEVAVLIVNDVIDKLLLQKINVHCQVKKIGRKKGSRSLIPWIKLNAFLYAYKPDIIHFHLEGMRRMVFHPAPKVFTIHNIHTSGIEYPKYQALYAISEGVRHYTKSQGFEATTVWNGIRTEEVKAKGSIGFNSGDFCKIVCIGRLYTPHKGQDILIQALNSLKNKGIINYHLDIIGDGESRERLNKMIIKLGMENFVSLLGQKDRSYIYQHLCDYDLFVLPSRSEGFGLSVVEAMCAKVPVLVCDLEGAMDVIDHGQLGLSFKAGASDSLADKIESFLEQGVNETKINDAYKYAKSNFDVQHTAKRYLEEYRKII